MSAGDIALAVGIGFASGFLSGQFGIGGGVVTTPAIRLLLARPALIAVGTPLPVILPTAIAGAISYHRRGLTDVRAGLTIGAFGAVASVVGALATSGVDGSVVMFVTAAVILYMAADMLVLAARRNPVDVGIVPALRHRSAAHRIAGFALLGLVTGLYSGFLGLGGGFIVVPALVRWFGFEMKRAIGTSLIVVSILSVPGSITHFALGHVDLGLVALLAIGVVPGALLGAKVTSLSSERGLKIGFAALLLFAGAILALSEAGVL